MQYTDSDRDWVGNSSTNVRDMPSVLLREGDLLSEDGGTHPTVEVYTRHDAGKTETLRLLRKISTLIERHWPDDNDPKREEPPDEEFLAEFPAPVVLCREANGDVFVDGALDTTERHGVSPPGDLEPGGWAGWIVTRFGDKYLGVVLETQRMVEAAIASNVPVRDIVREAHQLINIGEIRFWLEDAIQVQYRRAWNSRGWEEILANPLVTGGSLVYRRVGPGACQTCVRSYTAPSGALRLYTVAELERLSTVPIATNDPEEQTARICETHEGCRCGPWQLYKPFLAGVLASSNPERRKWRVDLGLMVDPEE